MTLKRRQYKHPVIVVAVGQVVLDWGETGFEDACKRLEACAIDEKLISEAQTTYEIVFDTHQPGNLKRSESFGGFIFRHVDGHEIIIERTGFRVKLSGDYAGRGLLFNLVRWVLDKGFPVDSFSVPVKRVSVAYACNISPDADVFKIEDYIVPNFELEDPYLQSYKNFSHRVMIDLKPLTDLDQRAILTVSADADLGGVRIGVDVLDDRISDISDVMDRLLLVKDLESHVFESVITDKTRALYGVID